jgi:hypothetical protein
MAENTLINGSYHDFSSIGAAVDDSSPIEDLSEISYSHKVERTKFRGKRRQPHGHTKGEYEAEGSITMSLRAAQKLRRRLGQGYMDVPFNIPVTFADDDTQGVITDKLIGCKIKNEENAHSRGTEGLMVKFDLDISYLILDEQEPIQDLRK